MGTMLGGFMQGFGVAGAQAQGYQQRREDQEQWDEHKAFRKRLVDLLVPQPGTPQAGLDQRTLLDTPEIAPSITDPRVRGIMSFSGPGTEEDIIAAVNDPSTPRPRTLADTPEIRPDLTDPRIRSLYQLLGAGGTPRMPRRRTTSMLDYFLS